jgi:hypothetical protein
MPTTLRLQFQGVSLWMDRKTHIDVLFPDATRVNLDAHTVTTTIAAKETVIDRTVLDFRSTIPAAGRQSAGITISGLLRVAVAADAPAAKPDAAFDVTHTLAAVRLPIGGVTSLRGEVDGPFEYEERTDVRVGYGARWDCQITDPAASIFAEVFDQKTAVLLERRDFGPVPGDPADPLFIIKSLSQWDRDHPDATIEPGEVLEDFEALGVLSRGKNSPPFPKLTFLGGSGEADATGGPSASAGDGLTVTIRRPCAPGYGDPGW